MSPVSATLFYLSSAVAIFGAVGAVASRNPLRGALALLFHIVSLAGLYILLHAHLLGALQLLVYAGAVVVLFIFVIMLIGPSATTPPSERGLVTRALSFSAFVLFTCVVTFAVFEYRIPREKIPSCAPDGPCEPFGGVGALGRAMYQDGVVPFELAGVLLLVAVIGAVAIARGRTAKEALAFQQRRKAEREAALQEEAKEPQLVADGGHS